MCGFMFCSLVLVMISLFCCMCRRLVSRVSSVDLFEFEVLCSSRWCLVGSVKLV